MPFQRIYQRWKKGHEPLGADAVSGMPDQEQRVGLLARNGVDGEASAAPHLNG